MTRTGKIARLPRDIREELNRRLRDGEQGKQLVAWLNSLPETQSMIEQEFSGRPISEQNLSEWKQGGYPEWLAHQIALESVRNLRANAGELLREAGALGDDLAIVVMARYAGLLAQWDGTPNGRLPQDTRALRAFCADIVELRRGDHNAARLKLDRERWETEQMRWEAEQEQRKAAECAELRERFERLTRSVRSLRQDFDQRKQDGTLGGEFKALCEDLFAGYEEMYSDPFFGECSSSQSPQMDRIKPNQT